MAEDLAEALAGLRTEWGIDFPRARAVLSRLGGGRWSTLSEVVEDAGVPRRDVEGILRHLEPWLEHDGELLRLDPFVELEVKEARLEAEGEIVDRLAGFAAGLPPSLWRLDHVPATPLTMASRALHLATSFDLTGASVLCLGDHDLTSLALGLLEPGAEVAVVDIDERVLDHIRSTARGEGLAVTTAFADLRLGLPPSLVGTADLVFTDPPYTPEGVRLFLARGLEALRRSGHERLVFCYGTGERHLVRALDVQAVVQGLGLAIEGLSPGFNRYHGAEAIGSRSSLYVCRPTTRTWARRSKPLRADPRIYTRGQAAEGSRERPPPDETIEVGEFVARTAAWAVSPTRKPAPFGPAVALDLRPDFGSSLVRVLLMAAPERAVLTAPAASLRLTGPVRRLLESVYDLTAEGTILTANRHDRPPANAPGSLFAALVLHPGAKVGNAWREALVAQAGLTKNEARARISATGVDPSLLGLRTWELPLSGLAELVAAVERSGAAT